MTKTRFGLILKRFEQVERQFEWMMTLEHLERQGLAEEVGRLRAAMQDLAREKPKIARVFQKHGLL